MKTLSRLVAISALLGLAGCNILPEPQKDTVRYFTLSTPTMQAADDQAAATKDQAETGGTTVRPVQIAGHLRERSMAVRVAENEIIYLDEVRWAQPLADAITNLLRERLSHVGGNNVVTVQIHNCEPLRFKGNTVELSATWEIVALGGGQPIRGEFTSATRTWDGKDYRELVSELRGTVEDLSDAIASAIAAKKCAGLKKTDCITQSRALACFQLKESPDQTHDENRIFCSSFWPATLAGWELHAERPAMRGISIGGARFSDCPAGSHP